MKIPAIEYHPVASNQKVIFSIIIPSWNNLSYLKACVESIQQHSAYSHQIIVHINGGTDGTLKWVQQQGLSYSYSEENVGVSYAFNAAASLATSDWICLSDDDFYYTPNWDVPLWQEVQQDSSIYRCISGTIIEPIPSPFKSMISPKPFGRHIDEFEKEKFLNEYQSYEFNDWSGANWYPMVLHRKLWQLTGGLSVEFSPGSGSDPDMMMKLWHSGVRYFKGVSKSRVYHFVSRSTSRIVLNNGHRQFLLKWGISISTFFKAYLRMGEPFCGNLKEPDKKRYQKRFLKDKLKRLLLR